MSIQGVFCIPLSFKEGGGYSPPSPSPKSATVPVIIIYNYRNGENVQLLKVTA